MTLQRMRQVREVIWERQAEQRLERLRLKEVELQMVVGAIHAAAGNKRGVRAAQKIRLTGRQRGPARSELAARMFPAEQGEYGLLDPAEIERARVELAHG